MVELSGMDQSDLEQLFANSTGLVFEDRQQYLRRVARWLSDQRLESWEWLPDVVKLWGNEAAEAINARKVIPDFNEVDYAKVIDKWLSKAPVKSISQGTFSRWIGISSDRR